MRAVADAVAALALAAADAEPARAEDLPAALAAAARLIPADDPGQTWQRRVCLALRIAADDGPRITVGTVAAGGAYSMATRGAFFGLGPADGPAPPFARALLDAGAAERVRLEWFERRILPFTGVPMLEGADAGSGAPAPTPAPREKRVPMPADACTATGPDAARLAPDPNLFGPSLPRVETGGPPDAGGFPAAAAPPGVCTPSRFCHDLVPDRVLGYDEPTTNPRSRRHTIAAIRFHRDRVLPWIADHRAIEASQRWMRPDEVRMIGFSDHGDGWRHDISVWGGVRARTYLVGQGRP